MEEISVEFNTIEQFNRYFGFETLHPLVSIIRQENDIAIGRYTHRYGIYALFLKENKGCTLSYGRTSYDFDEMTITSFAPGQSVIVSRDQDSPIAKWTAIAFHPDFLARTNLGRNMLKYGFFSYNSNEALHLSAAEVDVIRSIISIISQEMHHSIDRHTRQIIINNLEMLLNYCLRFYERQFITREEINHSVVANFECLLNDYLLTDASDKGLPSVSYFADKCCLSPGYFGQLVKTETGKTAQDFIADHIVLRSKELLSDVSLSVSQVSAYLGFEYPQHFIRFFKRHTGLTPSAYRA